MKVQKCRRRPADYDFSKCKLMQSRKTHHAGVLAILQREVLVLRQSALHQAIQSCADMKDQTTLLRIEQQEEHCTHLSAEMVRPSKPCEDSSALCGSCLTEILLGLQLDRTW